jgi:RNA polymerase sigma-70 factor (ECF subfamily)
MMPGEDRELRLDELLTHRRFVYSIARELLDDGSRADDVVQETLLQALAARGPRPRSLRAWLAGVARRIASTIRRGETRRAARELRAAAASPPVPVPTADEILEREATRRAVVDAVLALREPYRTPVLLHYFEELPPARIAAQLGVPVNTVLSHLHRARQQLRERLDRRCGRAAWIAAIAPLAVREPALATGAAGATVAAGGVVMAVVWKVTIAAVAIGSLAFWSATRWRADASRVREPALASGTPVATGSIGAAADAAAAAPSRVAATYAPTPAVPADAAAAPRLHGRITVHDDGDRGGGRDGGRVVDSATGTVSFEVETEGAPTSSTFPVVAGAFDTAQPANVSFE